MTEPKTQADKFKEAAKEHGADPSVKHWEERLRKVAASPSESKQKDKDGRSGD